MTSENYFAAIGQIEAYDDRNPLLPSLRKGHNALNEVRVISILQKMSTQRIEQEQKEKEAEQEEVMMMDSDDENLKMLFVQKSNLFVSRAKFSNRLHECENDHQRSEVIDNILQVQREIEDIFEAIRQYRATGVMPDEGTEFRIPTDGLALARLQNTLRASISRKRAEIKELLEREQNTTNQNKIDKADKALKSYELHLKHVSKEIERRQQPVSV